MGLPVDVDSCFVEQIFEDRPQHEGVESAVTITVQGIEVVGFKRFTIVNRAVERMVGADEQPRAYITFLICLS